MVATNNFQIRYYEQQIAEVERKRRKQIEKLQADLSNSLVRQPASPVMAVTGLLWSQVAGPVGSHWIPALDGEVTPPVDIPAWNEIGILDLAAGPTGHAWISFKWVPDSEPTDVARNVIACGEMPCTLDACQHACLYGVGSTAHKVCTFSACDAQCHGEDLTANIVPVGGLNPQTGLPPPLPIAATPSFSRKYAMINTFHGNGPDHNGWDVHEIALPSPWGTLMYVLQRVGPAGEVYDQYYIAGFASGGVDWLQLYRTYGGNQYGLRFLATLRRSSAS